MSGPRFNCSLSLFHSVCVCVCACVCMSVCVCVCVAMKRIEEGGAGRRRGAEGYTENSKTTKL